MRNAAGLHWMFGDHLGSSSTVRTPAGTNVRQRYLPFGPVRGAAGLPTEYGFTGQRLDPSGLMDYNARQYDPVLGRFTSPDTIIPDSGDPQSFNRYSYVNNNPVNFTDPSGHEPCIAGGGRCEDAKGSARDSNSGLKGMYERATLRATGPTDSRSVVEPSGLLSAVVVGVRRLMSEVEGLGRHSKVAQWGRGRHHVSGVLAEMSSTRTWKVLGRAMFFGDSIEVAVGVGESAGKAAGAYLNTGDAEYALETGAYLAGRNAAQIAGGDVAGLASGGAMGTLCAAAGGLAGIGCAIGGQIWGNVTGADRAGGWFDRLVTPPAPPGVLP